MERKSYTLSVFIIALFSAGISSIVLAEVLFLRYELSAEFTMIGSLLGFAALAYLLFSPFIRLIAERFGHGHFLTWTGLGMSVAAIFSVLVPNPGLYLAPRLVLSLFAPATLPVVISLCGELLRSVPDKNEKMFSLVVAGIGGSLIGFVGAGMVAREVITIPYLFGAGCFFVGGLLGTGVTNSVVSRSRQKLVLNPFVRLERGFSRDVRPLAVLVFVSAFLLVVRDFVFPLLFWERGFSLLLIGLTLGLFSVGTLLFLLPVRRLLSKNPPQQLLLLGVLVVGVGLLFVPLPIIPLMLLGVFLFGLGDAAVTPGVGDVARESVHGSEAKKVITALGAASSLSFVLSPILVGMLLEAGIPYWGVVLLSGLVALWLFLYLRRSWKQRQLFPRLSWRKKRKFLW